VLAGCSHDKPALVLSPDAGAAPGYKPNTQITLADGAVVTLPDGAPVTTPEVKGATPGAAASTTSTSAGYVQTGGPVSFNAPADPPALAFPKLGTYSFRETITPDDGGASSTEAVDFALTSPDQHVQVRWQQADASDSYIETHADGGLWLTASTLTGADACDWSPRSPELPKAVIAKVGASVTAESTCTTKLNGEDAEFKLKATVKSIDYEDLIIGGTTYRCIKVARDRELTQGATKLISTTHEWYAFDLGIRVKLLDHTVSRNDQEERSQSRDLVLTARPA
jgi:hypothetical protein